MACVQGVGGYLQIEKLFYTLLRLSLGRCAAVLEKIVSNDFVSPPWPCSVGTGDPFKSSFLSTNTRAHR